MGSKQMIHEFAASNQLNHNLNLFLDSTDMGITVLVRVLVRVTYYSVSPLLPLLPPARVMAWWKCPLTPNTPPSTPFLVITSLLISPNANQNESTEKCRRGFKSKNNEQYCQNFSKSGTKTVLPIQPTSFLFFPFFVLIKWNSGVLSYPTPPSLFLLHHWLPLKCVQQTKVCLFSLSSTLHFIIVYDYTHCKQHFATLSPPHQNLMKKLQWRIQPATAAKGPKWTH